MDFIVKRVLRDSGLEAACRGVRSIGAEQDLADVATPGGYLSRIAAGEVGVLARLREACRTALEHDGAEVIVLGCTCLSAVAETLAADCPATVINPRLAGVRRAMSLLSRGVERDRPTFRSESLTVLAQMLDAVSQAPAEACPTCIVGPIDPEAQPSKGD